MSSKKKSKSNKGGLDDFLHTKPDQWTMTNVRMFVPSAFVMACIPTALYTGAYDYRPEGYFGLEQMVWVITIGLCILGLLSSYTRIFVDGVHFLKCSASKGGEKQQRLFEAQSFYWTLFYINSVYIALFFLANFYAFKESIPNIHFRYALSTIGPSAAIHLWINGKNQTNQQQQ